MEKNHLKPGSIIFPTKLKLKKNLKISIIGAGEIAFKYAEVIKSFNHNIEAVLTRSKSKKNLTFIKKFNIENHFTNFDDFKFFIIKNNISAVIVCVSWDQNLEIFNKILSLQKPILFEKSIIVKSSQLEKINKNYKTNHITFAFNRNYYDYFNFLVNFNKINKPKIIYSNLADQFQRIIEKRGSSIKKNIHKYITIHWICFIYVFLKKIGLELDYKKRKQNFQIINLNKYKIIKFEIKNKFCLIISIIPNNPTNNKIEIISNNYNSIIEPFEKLEIFDKLILNEKNKIRTYKKKLFFKNIVNKKYKEGFRYMYYDFIKNEVKNFSKSEKSIKLRDLINIYKLCELL